MLKNLKHKNSNKKGGSGTYFNGGVIFLLIVGYL